MTKRTFVVMALVLVALPGMALAEEAAPGDLAVDLLGSSCLGFASQTDASGAAPATGEFLEPEMLTGCTAELTCWGGNVISCSGTQNCDVDCGSVTCDDNWVECTCTPPLSCPGWETAYCNCRSCGGTHQQCFQCWCVNGGVNCGGGWGP